MARSTIRNLDRRTFLLATGVAGAATLTASPAAAVDVLHPRTPCHRPVDQGSIDAVTTTIETGLVALRRDLHAHPELPGHESRTAAVVADRLRAAGLDVTTGVGGHGVVAMLRGSSRGRTVAYRADMDAVPPGGTVGGVTELAHKCGHDVHTTVGVGIAEVLARHRSRLVGNVAFVFQPAEESLLGAQAMLDEGVLRSTGAQEIHALHCAPLPVGSLAVTPGFGMPGLDSATVTLTGPDASARANALAREVSALSTVSYPRTLEEINQLVTDFTTPDGPLARFINIQDAVVTDDSAGSATVGIDYRCWPEERYLEVRGSIRALADEYGARVQFPDAPFPALVCPEREGYMLERHLRRVVGRENTLQVFAAPPFNGEDFALFARQVPVTYTFLGVRAPDAMVTTAFPHHIDFDPDERAIGVGVRAMAGFLADRARRPAVAR